MLDYVQKSAAEQTRSSREKLVKYVVTNYVQHISNEVKNKINVNLVEPVHETEVITQHTIL